MTINVGEHVVSGPSISRGKATFWIINTAVGPLGICMFLANAYIFFWYLQTQHQGRPPMHVILRGVQFAAAPGLWLSVLLWWFIWRKRTSFARMYRLHSPSPVHDILAGLIAGICLVALYWATGVLTLGEMFTLDAAKFWSLPTSVSAGFCEEFLFRGFVFLVIARAGGGLRSQVAFSSVAFATAHVLWGPWGMLATLVLGFVLGALRSWTGSVWSAVIAHTVLNLCIEPGLMEKAMTGGFQR